ncbi:hypothetical protein ACW5F0_14590 [Luteimonas sp. A534]
MYSRPIALLVAVSATLAPAVAHGGVYSDSLAKCLVERTSDQDKILLAKWIFTVIAAHPSAASLATVDGHQKSEVVEGTGKLFETLLTESCHEETAKAVRYEGSEALGISFKVLGEIAMNTLLTDPKVQAETENFMQHVDAKKLEQAFALPAGG